MKTWQPIADEDGTVTFPHKGARVRVEEHFQAHLAGLSGAQMKLGATHIPETIGVMRDARGIGRKGQSQPDAVEFAIAADDGETRVVTLPFTVESLARVSVEVGR